MSINCDMLCVSDDVSIMYRAADKTRFCGMKLAWVCVSTKQIQLHLVTVYMEPKFRELSYDNSMTISGDFLLK